MAIDFDLSKLDDYLTSEDLEKDGIWMENFTGGIDIKIRRAGGANRKYTHALLAAVKPYKKRRTGLDDLDPDISDKLLRRVYARTIVVDWRGVTGKDGKEIECTPEAVEELFKLVPELMRDVMELASSPRTFNEHQIEEAMEALGED
ncbi:MAG: hypothetical protein K0U84_24740 [Actinomycetia bacterium]|nr:hypothetical protein [Actinomycetes bacterium]